MGKGKRAGVLRELPLEGLWRLLGGAAMGRSSGSIRFSAAAGGRGVLGRGLGRVKSLRELGEEAMP